MNVYSADMDYKPQNSNFDFTRFLFFCLSFAGVLIPFQATFFSFGLFYLGMIAKNLLNSLKIRNRLQLQPISRSACATGKQYVYINVLDYSGHSAICFLL